MRRWLVTAAICLAPSLAGANTFAVNIQNAAMDEKAAKTWRVGLIAGGIAPGETPDTWYFGKQTLGGSAPDQYTAWRLGSVTKSFTGFLTALQSCYGAYTGGPCPPSPPPAPEEIAPVLALACPSCVVPLNRQHITFEQLATHTAGLPPMHTQRVCSAQDHYLAFSNCFVFYGMGPPPTDCLAATCPGAQNPLYCSMVYNPPYPTSGMAESCGLCSAPTPFLNTCVPAPAPYQYSNWSFNLLGELLVANAGASSWHDLNKTELLTPLGMTSKFVDDDQTPAGVTKGQGYDCPPSSPCTAAAPKDQPDWGNPAGGLWSTGPDMLGFLKYVMNLFVLDPLSPLIAARTLALSPHALDGSSNPVGLGWQQRSLTTVSGSHPMWFKAGDGAGFYAYIAWVPATSVGAYAISNGGDPSGVKNVVENTLKNY
jgi:CubicO group peptidase (beta-lactamase class C family)